ncbi:TIGR01440 family protein [Priestia abyssalis]|uniref:TIGR01440 family protein n=1 Tax=Priestia abyssalis TaxID=1221450 RepID=UPI000995D04B|nr:TIGR01440 family protein [Priestia abyssalis]
MDAMLVNWKQELQAVLEQFSQQVTLTENQVFVIGCSTSEVMGEKIGTAGTSEVAQMIFETFKEFQLECGVQLAFQCCEHLNRALVVEKQTAVRNNWEMVSVIPVPKAGGSMAAYAYEQMDQPVMVEFIKADAGIDIGDTFIGMHLKHVAVPIRCSVKQVGSAHVTLATTRPKLIGGARAVYERTDKNNTCS